MSTATETTLKPIVKTALVELLYRLGDDALVIGHRNSEWTGIGPILEEDIAFSSMAQDKIGHAQAYYHLLHELGEQEPDRLAFTRAPDQFRCCSLVYLETLAGNATTSGDKNLRNNPDRDRLMLHGDWAIGLMRQFLFSEADALRLAALSESAYAPLAQLARKLRGEVKYHTMHGRTLVARLGDATTESHARMQTALDTLWPHALGLFEPTPHDELLAESGIAPRETELCDDWRADVEPRLGEAGLDVPDDARPAAGGRKGQHGPALKELLDSLQRVHRLDPAAQW